MQISSNFGHICDRFQCHKTVECGIVDKIVNPVVTFLQEKSKEEALARTLEEKQQEMILAIEERELQKMAAISQQDTAQDELKEKLQEYIEVMCAYVCALLY